MNQILQFFFHFLGLDSVQQRPKRQDSYLQAISGEIRATSPPNRRKAPRQPSYQEAMSSASIDVNRSKIEKRQSSYQKAVGTMSPEDSLPDLNAADVAHAAVKIQAAYKGFKIRKQVENRKKMEEDLPDLKDKAVQDATIKIQSAFKGFNVRKHNKEQAKAAKIIQRNFKGYIHRKKSEKAFADAVDQAYAAIKIQKVYR